MKRSGRGEDRLRRADIPKLMELLKQKVNMGILEPSSAPNLNRWFTVPRNNGTPRFIQDLQAVNKVTIRNARIGRTIDEFAEAFAGRSVYSVGDLYSGYNQFLLAVESGDITTMRTPLGLVRMCTLPQAETNSVADMVNAMNKKVLRDYIPDITMPFLDDIPFKGCPMEDKDAHQRLQEGAPETREHVAYLLCRKVGFRIVRDLGSLRQR